LPEGQVVRSAKPCALPPFVTWVSLISCSFGRFCVYVGFSAKGNFGHTPRKFHDEDRKGMKIFSRPIDLTGVSTVVYHLPDGPALSLKIEGIEAYLDLELELGHVCDTSDIDGVLHFFPRGNA
jgi:hypothetical protein